MNVAYFCTLKVSLLQAHSDMNRETPAAALFIADEAFPTGGTPSVHQHVEKTRCAVFSLYFQHFAHIWTF